MDTEVLITFVVGGMGRELNFALLSHLHAVLHVDGFNTITG